MLARTLLLVLPVATILTVVGLLVLIPISWILRDPWPMYAAARVVVRMLMRLAGVRVEVSGPDPRLAPQPCLYLANHNSNLDPPVLWPYLPRVVVMAKAAVFRYQPFGYAMKFAGFIPVERNKPDSRLQALDQGVSRLRQGVSMLVFPEGTRSRDGNLLPFRPGPFTMAIEAQAPIVPITILGSGRVMSRGQWVIRPGRVRVVFHPPVPTKGLSQADRRALMQKVRSMIASALTPEPEQSQPSLGALKEIPHAR